MKRPFTIAVVADLLIAIVVLNSGIKDFLWTHPWWHSFPRSGADNRCSDSGCAGIAPFR